MGEFQEVMIRNEPRRHGRMNRVYNTQHLTK
jgi:hypothetical protein